MSLLTRWLIRRAYIKIGPDPSFQELYFSIYDPIGAYLNRQQARPLLNFLAQLRYRPAIEILRRFERSDHAYREILRARY